MSRKKTILLVDDDKTFALYLGILLKRMGFTVSTSESGAEALRLIEASCPDLVLLEINIPAPDGLETLRKIRSDSRFNGLPVIMISGEPDDRKLLECSAAGCNGYLDKPIPMDELHGFLQDFVYGRAGTQRKHLRVQTDMKVMLFKDGSSRELRTDTLSEGGVYLRTDSPFAVGTDVEVVLDDAGKTLKLRGSVIYIRDSLDVKAKVPPGMAVEFTDVSKEAAATLGRLVSGLMAGDMGAGGAIVYMNMEGRGR